jgi:hypothetical protein
MNNTATDQFIQLFWNETAIWGHQKSAQEFTMQCWARCWEENNFKDLKQEKHFVLLQNMLTDLQKFTVNLGLTRYENISTSLSEIVAVLKEF